MSIGTVPYDQGHFNKISIDDDRTDFCFKLERNCLGRLILTIFACCLCVLLTNPDRERWKKHRIYLLQHKPPESDIAASQIWNVAMRKVRFNLPKYQKTIYSSTNSIHHEVSYRSSSHPSFSVSPQLNTAQTFRSSPATFGYYPMGPQLNILPTFQPSNPTHVVNMQQRATSVAPLMYSQGSSENFRPTSVPPGLKRY